MAIDVVVRPSGKCITLVCDPGTPIAEALVLKTNDLYSKIGKHQFHIGTLTPSMADDALLCDHAVIVIMDDTTILSSREAEFIRVVA